LPGRFIFGPSRTLIFGAAGAAFLFVRCFDNVTV